MANYNGNAEYRAQTSRITILNNELLSRSPSRWAEVRAFAGNRPYDTGAIESMILDHLAELDRQDETPTPSKGNKVMSTKLATIAPQSAMPLTNRATALLVSNSESEIKEAARKLMRMTPGGNRLNSDQALDLAVYSFITQLNPFNNECYYMAQVGPVPGIAGYRIKATGWLRATCPNAQSPRTEEEYRPATRQEADFDPDKGDVAWVCILSDTVSTAAWEKRRLELMRSYREMGAEFHEAYELAAKDAGRRPCWIAVGVVHGDEHFSGNVWRNNQKVEGEYKPAMWDRNERAKKRAAKGCYRKGFPQVNIPDAEEGEIFDAEVREVKDHIAASIAATNVQRNAPRTEAEIMGELYGEPVQQPAQVIEPEQETEPEQAEPQAVDTENFELMTIPDLAGRHAHYTKLSRDVAKTDAERIQAKSTADYIETLIKAKRAK